jgi:hypothetical protein
VPQLFQRLWWVIPSSGGVANDPGVQPLVLSDVQSRLDNVGSAVVGVQLQVGDVEPK